MTEILTFPNKPQNNEVETVPYKYTPKGALEYVLSHMEEGNTSAKTLVIAWVEEDQGEYNHRYMVGGGNSLSDVVGLIEITKSSMLA